MYFLLIFLLLLFDTGIFFSIFSPFYNPNFSGIDIR